MKDLLAKLLGMFHKPEATKVVEPWPFPPVVEVCEPREKCCGGCKKPAKKPAVKKPVAKKTVDKKKPAIKKAKK